jgi:beta-galactosidase
MFKVSGGGKLIGVGNGDPTDQASDKGTSRKAFCGCCMAVVQSTKQSGNISVEASSPGLAPATVTLPVEAVTLRPQVPLWERQVPKGEGITGLWRPIPPEGRPESSALPAMGDSIYSLKQEGSSLAGTVEGTGANFFGGGDVPAPIVNGTINGSTISFTVGNSSFTGNIKGDHIELQRSASPGSMPSPAEKAADAPDIGPAPDGSDPSRGPSRPASTVPVVLRRVER